MCFSATIFTSTPTSTNDKSWDLCFQTPTVQFLNRWKPASIGDIDSLIFECLLSDRKILDKKRFNNFCVASCIRFNVVNSSDIRMKGGVRYRLSPNEAARVIQEEKERRRKLRIVQVFFLFHHVKLEN